MQYLPDARIETKAIQLLNRYESEYDAVTGPPIPVEEIADNLLELGVLWGSVSEAAGTTTLAGLEPKETQAHRFMGCLLNALELFVGCCERH